MYKNCIILNESILGIKAIGKQMRAMFNRDFFKDWSKIKDGLMEFVKNASTEDDIKFLRNDLNIGLTTIKKRISNSKDEKEKKSIEDHLKWLETDYRDLLKNKLKKIKDKKN